MPSGKVDLTQFAGMVTAPGLLARNPASCLDALNWEFPAPGLIRKRRGFARQTGNTGGPVWALMTSRLLDLQVLAHVGTASIGTQLRVGSGSGALAAVPTIDSRNLTRNPALPSALRMKLAVCQRNHYVTADESVARVESGLSVARYAGMPRGQGTIASGYYLVGGTANPLADGFARAYRVTWHRKDADDVELGGAPTQRWSVANRSYEGGYPGPATPRAVTVELAIPVEFGTEATALTTSYFWRLWGTHTYDEAGGQLGNDEMFLVSERLLTAGEITAGHADYTDDTPDAFLLSSPRLHTNLYNFPPGEVGLLQGVANEDAPPPIANDVAYWQDVMWFADYSFRPRITLALISNFAPGDTVTTNSSTVSGGTVTLTAGTDFGIITGSGIASVNIRKTVELMVAAFNAPSGPNAGQGIWGYSVGTSSTQPGLFYLELAQGATASFTFSTSVPTKFQTTEGYVFGTGAPQGAATNGLMFSKPLRADAVPPVNGLTAGPATSRVLRIFPYRDRLLVFTDNGIYQVTGRTFADFAVNPFDLGYRLLGREMVGECDEKVYAWCIEGMVEIDDGGVTVISTPIEPTIEAAMVTAARGITPILQTGRAAVGQLGFVVAYRNQHQVRFHYPGAVDLAHMYGSENWLSFDTRTRAWARGTFSSKAIDGYPDARTAGVVRFGDDLLCVGCWSTGADTFLFLERRDYVAGDFTDDARDATTASVVSTLRFQYQLPDEAGAQHWQQTVVNWDAEEISWRPLPSLVSVLHATEEVTGAAQLLAVTELATRWEPPQAMRRGQRLYVQVAHNLTEYAGIVGLSQAYRQGSRFARRVAP